MTSIKVQCILGVKGTAPEESIVHEYIKAHEDIWICPPCSDPSSLQLPLTANTATNSVHL